MSAYNGSGSADLLQYSNNNSKFHIGDKVTVVGIPTITFTSGGVNDELGTEKLLKSMLGGVYTVRDLTNAEFRTDGKRFS